MGATQYDPNDSQYEEETLAEVNKGGNGWTLKRSDGWSFFTDAGPIEPKPGMTARFYGQGIGHTVRGLVIDGHTFYYRTEAEEQQRHAEWVENLKRERAEEYERTKDETAKRLAAYPEVFRKRIERFLANSPTAWEHQDYEMAVCDAALAILKVYKSTAELDAWRESDYGPDLPGLGEMGLSGNQHGMAVRLAYWGLTEPENVWKEHAAISPLIGYEEAGCLPVEAPRDRP